MPPVITPGIVLHFANYRDNDRMLTLLTPQYGGITVCARGCRRPKSPLLPASEWFAYGEFTLFRSRESYTLTSFSLQDSFYPLRLEPYRLYCAAYMGALCRETVQQDCEAADLFALLLKGLYYLAYADEADALATATAFALLFADQAGYRPRLTRCIHCNASLNLDGDSYLDTTAGGLCCPACRSRSAIRLSHEQVVWISRTLREKRLLQTAPVDKELFRTIRDYTDSCMDIQTKAGQMLP